MSAMQEAKPLRPVLFAAAGASIFEMYDFSVYGYMASYVATNFFPTRISDKSALLMSFGVYSASFFMRTSMTTPSTVS